jgi:hypothetical protein
MSKRRLLEGTDYLLRSKKWSPLKEGTGVVHFLANKIRIQGQARALDGSKPTYLIVPVMSLEDARKWRGESYHAICLAGVPTGDFADVNNGELYKTIGLADSALMKVEQARDSESKEVGLLARFWKRRYSHFMT